ncbi:hypothetical protein KXD93_02110 [Mucilaginibacter sp. BJC16-A38]|uniref:hypothetical protein n=1 Tax=Mucilaginibacter phenanthrenivorans TaxID=1234842 RepID=UPI0021580186|nr:hypothetical protein [Mucilaginibacter phenanthrenivorans]MCR8556415.1 hypothetical protein [Mucilaginibacter phenanthrenivorans]
MKIILAAALFLIISNCFGQVKKIDDFAVYNRVLTINNDGRASVIHLNESANNGVAWIKGMKFTNGNIEFDVMGKDVLQQSFVGVAFHGVNDTTYDAIYFRPFNFRSADPEKKVHHVQYISDPKFEWMKLRAEFPGKYEKGITVPPDPNGWFHVRIAVKGKKFSVFVNGDAKPSLEVEQLVKLTGDMIGFWAGNGSGGDWKNLRISN